jgi:hypothetical protein
MVKYTRREQKLMRAYERRECTKLMSAEEKLQEYRSMSRNQLENNLYGVSNAISARQNLNNSDAFEGEDDQWKLKMLQENLELIRQVERER